MMYESIIQERNELIERYLEQIPKSNSNLPSLFLSGVSRAGKSQLAQALSNSIGLEIIYLDPIREFYYDITDYVSRLEVKKTFYQKLLEKCGNGYIFEGYDSVVRNQSWDYGDTDVSMSLFKSLEKNNNFNVLLIGYANADPKQKLLGVRKWHQNGGHRCYLNGTDEAHQKSTIKKYIDVSRKIRDKSAGHYLYIDVSDSSFDKKFSDELNMTIREFYSTSDIPAN
jgi:hypothetical protein